VLGTFHGDPHPGNLFITPEGRICFHDFGLVGSLDKETRRRLAAYTSAFMHQDADWMLDAAIAPGILGGVLDRVAFRRALAEIIADFAALPLKEWSLAEAFLRVARLGRAQNVFAPYHLAVLMRALFEAESIVRTLDPEFALLQTLKVEGPKVLNAALGVSDWKNALARLESDALMVVHDLPAVLRTWARHLNGAGEGPGLGLRLHGLEGLEAHFDRSSNRLALALVTLGLYIAGSLLLMGSSLGPRLIGGLPAFAAFAYALALWFTFRLARAIARSGRL
jgi:ubiquinone biosynthesis protein